MSIQLLKNNITPKYAPLVLLSTDILQQNNTPELMIDHFKSFKNLNKCNITSNNIKISNGIAVSYGDGYSSNNIALSYNLPILPTKCNIFICSASITIPQMFYFYITVVDTITKVETHIFRIHDSWTAKGGHIYKFDTITNTGVFTVTNAFISLDIQNSNMIRTENPYLLKIASSQNISGYSCNQATINHLEFIY